MVQTQARKSAEKPRSSQLKLLAGAVKRKSDPVPGVNEVKVQKVQNKENGNCINERKEGNGKIDVVAQESPPSKGGGGGLLGLGDYGSDSDSD